MTRANYDRERFRSKGGQRARYAAGNGGELVTLTDVTLGKETEKAILVSREGENDMWVPLSQVEKMVRSKDKGADSITITGWIAKQKGLA